jgi:hypothetical protein
MRAANRQPELLVVVDTEEEFDWTQPFDRANTATRSILAQALAHQIYDRVGVVPTYVVDYPVATDPVAIDFLGDLKNRGRAEIGAHLHSWVTPPHDEQVNARNSYQCNLSPQLKRAKIEALTNAIERAFGERPTVFKAGRHGLGPRTPAILAALGYKVDCSLLPYNDLRADGGPDFRTARDQPYWIDGAPGLLEVPVTTGFFGPAAGLGRRFPGLWDSSLPSKVRLPGILSRLGIVTRSRLTPEGVPAMEQCRLLKALVRGGKRTFTLAYHSPSLAPGNTPYVKNEAELADFLTNIEAVLTYFRDVLGGRFTTMTELHARMSAERQAEPAVSAAQPQLRPAAAAGRGKVGAPAGANGLP